MRIARILAYAKLNLSLAVLGSRSDGYHDIDSIVQTVDLADTIELRVRQGCDIVVENSLQGIQGPDLTERAAAALLRAKAARCRVEIHIVKHIPAGAGLGGGSSDAAAVLLALDRLTPPSVSAAELSRIAASIGSDVPLFLVGGCVRVTGRGDVVARLAESRREHFVIAAPAIHCPTADVYRAWTAQPPRDAAEPLGRNDLYAAAVSLHPEIVALGNAVASSAALFGGMSGSGSAFYAAFGDRTSASAAAEKLHDELPACVVHVCRATDTGSREMEGSGT